MEATLFVGAYRPSRKGSKMPRYGVATLIASVMMFAACAADQAKAPSLGSVIELDISGPRPTAQLAANTNAPVTVIFDTGAGGTVINRATAGIWGLPVQGRAMIGSPAGGVPTEGILTRIDRGRLGEAEFSDARVVVADLPLPSPDAAGVASPTLFAGALVRFEFGKSRAIVLPKDAGAIPAGEAHPYDAGPRPLPSAPIDIAGETFLMHLDTGSMRGILLPLDAASRLPLDGPLSPTEPLRGIGGEIQAFRGRLAGTAQIGPLTLQNPEITFAEGSPHNIGMEILRQLTIVLDPEDRRSWILPAE